jgi:hypothetical protein
MPSSSQPLAVMDGKTLLELEAEPLRFIVSRFMPTGLHLLAGSPKVGKSWFALWLCDQVSKGAPLWEFPTRECGALYLSLEDTLDRLHFRLSRMTEDGSEQSYFAVSADNLSGELVSQLETFMRNYPNTGLIVIDALQRIRDSASTYARDYEAIGKLKAVADKHKIAILLVHHLRKSTSNDPFNRISGSTGITGAADTLYVPEKLCRDKTIAVLHVTGRDVEDMRILMELDRDTGVWQFISFTSPTNDNEALFTALVEFLREHGEFIGTATELLDRLVERDSTITIAPNTLTRILKEQSANLRDWHGMEITFSRNKSSRLVAISLIPSTGDDDDTISPPEVPSPSLEEQPVISSDISPERQPRTSEWRVKLTSPM